MFVGSLLAVVAGLGSSAPGPGRGAGARAARPTPHLEVRSWSDSLVSPGFLPADSTWARRSYPPDTLVNASRPRLTATYAPAPAALDGGLDDWHLVRWNDISGARSVVRGKASNGDDLEMQFALRWSTEGLLLGARLPERAALEGAPPAGLDRRRRSVLISMASSSPVVQRYWMGSSRTLRVWLDGRIEAWNDVRKARSEPFDPTALGARAAVHRLPGTGDSTGRVEVELLVPFDVLFPALPSGRDTLLCNVMVEERAAGSGKLAAWATRVEGKRPQAGWAWLEFAGGPEPGTWLVAQGTRHAEGLCEWAVAPWGRAGGGAAGGPVEVEVRGRDPSHGSWVPAQARLRRGPAILRIRDLPQGAGIWPADRRFEVEIGARDGTVWRRSEMFLAPADADFGPASAETEGLRRLTPSMSFPTVEDIRVRLDRARFETAALGEWSARRFHSTGILALRAGAWATVERWLEQAAAERDVLAGGPDSSAARQRLAALWPERTPSGVPVGRVLLRGYRSLLDDSPQPYALYVARHSADSTRAPLLVALHDLNQDELSLFEATPLVAQAEEHGWIVLCPSGRGGAGFQQAGERDVLDALAQARAQLPVDGRRLYLTGTGMGGTAAWLLSLRHPDLFAAACIVSGYGDLDQHSIFSALGYELPERDYFLAHNPANLLRPGLTTAYRVVHAERDAVIPVGHARFMDRRLTALGLAHETVIDPTSEHGASLMARDLPANFGFLASRRRASEGTPNLAPFGGAGGPVADVFARGPVAVAYGTRAARRATAAASRTPAVGAADSSRARLHPIGSAADSSVAQQVAQEWQALFGGRLYVLPDSTLPEVLARGANLVLAGDPQSNALVARWAEGLPVRYTAEGFELQGRSYDYTSFGILFATPNPEFPERTLVVLSGMGGRFGGGTKSLLKLGADWVITDAQQRVAAIGNFPRSR